MWTLNAELNVVFCCSTVLYSFFPFPGGTVISFFSYKPMHVSIFLYFLLFFSFGCSGLWCQEGGLGWCLGVVVLKVTEAWLQSLWVLGDEGKQRRRVSYATKSESPKQEVFSWGSDARLCWRPVLFPVETPDVRYNALTTGRDGWLDRYCPLAYKGRFFVCMNTVDKMIMRKVWIDLR